MPPLSGAVMVDFEFHVSRRDSPSFPTRRSSDLARAAHAAVLLAGRLLRAAGGRRRAVGRPQHEDRKSTRLNSSHVAISYAVFCWKKKRVKELEENSKERKLYADLDDVTRNQRTT